MKKVLKTTGKILDSFLGFLGGAVLALLVVMTLSTFSRLYEVSIPYFRLGCFLILFLFPIIGAKKSLKFMMFFVHLFNFFASDGGEGPVDNTGLSWRGAFMGVLYFVGVIMTFIAFVFSAHIPFIISVGILLLYTAYVFRCEEVQGGMP